MIGDDPKLGLFSAGELVGRDFESSLEYRFQNFEVDESNCFLRIGACVFLLDGAAHWRRRANQNKRRKTH